MARSPNYPSLALNEAINAMRPVYKEEHRSKMSQKVLAKHLGYGSLSGRALAKIGAIRAYGLIEGSGDELRVSDDAVILLTAPKGEVALQQAMERCALRPGLFADLRSENPGVLPSFENLRFQIVQRGFTDKAAEKAAENFLATMRLVSGSSGNYNPAELDTEQPDLRQPPQDQSWQTDMPPPPPPPPTPSTSPPYKIELAGDRLRINADVDLKGLKKLMKILQAQMPFLDDEDQEPSSSSIEN